MSLPAALAISLVSTTAPVAAEAVAYEYLGLTVVGNIEFASAKSLKDDGAIILVHDTLAHHAAPAMASLQRSLKVKGVNSLAISISLGLNERKGPFNCAHEHDHRHGDASDEIVAWVEWLQHKGANRISILGHGRGAAQVALAVAERPDLVISRLVLANPIVTTLAAANARFQQQFGKPLAPVLEQARKLVDEGEGDTLLAVPGFLTCPHARTTAAAFVDYYGGDNRQDIIILLPELKHRTLWISVGNDPLTKTIEKTLSPATISGALETHNLIDADPEFTGKSGDQLAELIVNFVSAK
jgi:pimeloyl-ACP methyl ester carboxylesterase